jgi:hypothetical protein
MTFLQKMGTGTRSWLKDPRDISTDVAGWIEYDHGGDKRRRAGEQYVEREWGDGVLEHGEAGEEAEGKEGVGDLAGVG